MTVPGGAPPLELLSHKRERLHLAAEGLREKRKALEPDYNVYAVQQQLEQQAREDHGKKLLDLDRVTASFLAIVLGSLC